MAGDRADLEIAGRARFAGPGCNMARIRGVPAARIGGTEQGHGRHIQRRGQMPRDRSRWPRAGRAWPAEPPVRRASWAAPPPTAGAAARKSAASRTSPGPGSSSTAAPAAAARAASSTAGASGHPFAGQVAPSARPIRGPAPLRPRGGPDRERRPGRAAARRRADGAPGSGSQPERPQRVEERLAGEGGQRRRAVAIARDPHVVGPGASPQIVADPQRRTGQRRPEGRARIAEVVEHQVVARRAQPFDPAGAAPPAAAATAGSSAPAPDLTAGRRTGGPPPGRSARPGKRLRQPQARPAA